MYHFATFGRAKGRDNPKMLKDDRSAKWRTERKLIITRQKSCTLEIDVLVTQIAS